MPSSATSRPKLRSSRIVAGSSWIRLPQGGAKRLSRRSAAKTGVRPSRITGRRNERSSKHRPSILIGDHPSSLRSTATSQPKPASGVQGIGERGGAPPPVVQNRGGRPPPPAVFPIQQSTIHPSSLQRSMFIVPAHLRRIVDGKSWIADVWKSNDHCPPHEC
jgi:hypothetical protein